MMPKLLPGWWVILGTLLFLQLAMALAMALGD